MPLPHHDLVYRLSGNAFFTVLTCFLERMKRDRQQRRTGQKRTWMGSGEKSVQARWEMRYT